MSRFTKKRILAISFFVAMPVIFGGLVYILFRSSSLLMFKWFDFVGILPVISTLRTTLNPIYPILPNWFLFSIPDALWVYSLTFFIGVIWYKGKPAQLFLFFIFSLLYGVLPEFLQQLNILPGSFDQTDLYFQFAASLIGVYSIHHYKKEAVW